MFLSVATCVYTNMSSTWCLSDSLCPALILASCPCSHFKSELPLNICSSFVPWFNSSMHVRWCLLFTGTPGRETALASTVGAWVAGTELHPPAGVQAMLAFKTCQGPHSPYFSGVILHISNTVLLAHHSILGFSVTLNNHIFCQLLGLFFVTYGTSAQAYAYCHVFTVMEM